MFSTMFVLKVLLIGSAIGYSFAITCSPLIQREGVEVKCEDPTAKTSLDCHSRQLPVGAIAQYACIRKFYVPLHSDIEHGKLTCNFRGKWQGEAQFLAFGCQVNCGVPPLGNAASSILDGSVTEKEKWPWHASIYVRPNSRTEFTYICGGTLIKAYTNVFAVLTAAHCMEFYGKQHDREDVKVVLATDYSDLELNKPAEGTQIHEARKIVIHKSYQGGSTDYQADIAIIFLHREVVLTNSVMPACFSRNVELVENGAVGDVVGFGRYHTELRSGSIVLRNISIPVVSQHLCFKWRNRKLNPQEICAGYEEPRGVCNGDSGGGYLFKSLENGVKRYYVQGIVSHGRKDLRTGEATCDRFSVFTKATSYAQWIRESAEAFQFDTSQFVAFAEGHYEGKSVDLGNCGCTNIPQPFYASYHWYGAGQAGQMYNSVNCEGQPHFTLGHGDRANMDTGYGWRSIFFVC